MLCLHYNQLRYEMVRNDIWDMKIRITKVTVALDYITVHYTVDEEPYILCNQHLRTWKAYNE